MLNKGGGARSLRAGSLAALLAVACLCAPAGASAAPLPCAGGHGNAAELASAIAAADASPAPSTIVLSPGCSYVLNAPDTSSSTVVAGKTVALHQWYGPSGLPAISRAITIAGNGASISRSAAPGTPPFRLFFVGADPSSPSTPGWVTPGAGHLTLQDLTLANGLAEGGHATGGGGGLGAGGAIYVQGALTLERVTLSGNLALGGGTVGENGGQGGGMDPAGSGGFGTGFIAPSTASKGSFDGGGGGLAEADSAAGIKGGGGGPRGSGTGGTGGSGGAVLAGIAGGFGGDGAGGGGDGEEPESSPKTATGGSFGAPGAAGISGSNGYGEGGGGGGVGGGGGPGAEGSGAGAKYGGGGGGGGFGGGGGKAIASPSGTAGGTGGQGGFGGGGGGGAPLGKPALGGFGGGAGTEGSTAGGIGGAGAGMGGAIFVHGGAVTAIDTTLAVNAASGGTSVATGGGHGSQPGGSGAGLGGAIFDLNGAVSLVNCTLAANTAEHGGALYVLGYDLSDSSHPATAALANDILSGSVGALGTGVEDLVTTRPPVVLAENVVPYPEPNVDAASVDAQRPNIVGSRSVPAPATLAGSPLALAPLLEPLRFNGGPGMATFLPRAGSPALGAGDPAVAPATDERGVPRPGRGPVDLGAVQVTTAVSGAAPKAKAPPPTISALRQTHSLWREGSKLAKIAARRRRPPVGTAFSFQLSQPARVLLTFTQRVPGRKVKGRCVAPSRRNRHAHRCLRTVVAGSFALQGHAGLDRLAFQGRLSARKRLRPGRYTVTFIATNAAGLRSGRLSLSFTIVG